MTQLATVDMETGEIVSTGQIHPAALIPPPLAADDYAELKSDIAANGLLHDIRTIGGLIIDGRHRFQICTELGIAPRFNEYNGPLSPLQYVLANVRHRHMTAGQKAAMALEIEAYEAAEAKKRMLAGVKVHPPANLPEGVNPHHRLKGDNELRGESREKAAAATGASARNVQEAKKLAKEAPDLLEKVKTGELSIHAAKRQYEENTRKENLARPVRVDLATGLYRGDFRLLSDQIADDSVDLVFTDPPYDGKSVTLYEDAARVASRILKPGGSFIAYSGQRHLPAVLSGCEKHLRYWWTIAGVHSGANQMLQKLGIRCGWKPLVWFVKGTRGDVQNVLRDVVTGDREKDAHVWQQAEEEALYYIEHLTSAGGLVVDFFVGGGTTAVASKKLRRQFIGFEVDASAAERASIRVSEAA
jgi:ParB-like chromosome segregation protein Spo0J